MKKLLLVCLILLAISLLFAACNGATESLETVGTSGVTTATAVTETPNTSTAPNTTESAALTTSAAPNTTETPDSSTASTSTKTPDSSTAPNTTEAPHVHAFGEWVTTKDASCTLDGQQERTCACGETESETIPAFGHTDGEWINDADPTCTLSGSKHRVCATCGEILRTETLDAFGHTDGEWINDADPTCTQSGSKHRVCATCGETLRTETLDAFGHTDGEWINDADPTCTLSGSKHRVCATCGETLRTETLDAFGHTEVVDSAVSPTCTETGLTEGKHCSVCHTVLVAQQTIAVTAHTYDDQYDETCNKCGFVREADCAHKNTLTIAGKEATCTKAGLTSGTKCAKCNEILVPQQIIAALGHTEVVDSAVSPTCTETGLTEGKHCSVCKATLVSQKTVDALGHTEVIDSAVSPTCTETGLTEGKHCSVCKATLVSQKTVDALGHTEVIDSAVSPTCTETGLTEGKHCSVCKATLIPQKTIAVTAHTYDNAYDETCNKCGFVRVPSCAHKNTVTLRGKAATCTVAGLTNGVKCAKCDLILVAQQTIPALGHNMVTEDAVAPSCTKWGASGHVECTLCHITIQEQTFIEPTGHTYVNETCLVCSQTKPDFSNISQYHSHEGDAFFETDANGNAMQRLYDDMEKTLTTFHNSSTANASFYQTHSMFGDVYSVETFNFSQYGLTFEQAYTVFLVFRKDHPVFYWMSSLVYHNNKVIVITTIEDYANGADRSRYNELLYETVASYVSLTDGETSAYTVALTYYEAILQDYEYAFNANGAPETSQWAHSIMGGIRYGKFVCEGYAKLFQLLLNYSGIPNMYVTGDAGGAHAWNLVRLEDGNWYWFDLTWGDTSGQYEYFCSLDRIFSDHIPETFNRYGTSFNVTLPSRAETPFESDAVLEIGEIFVIGKSTYYLASAGKVKLLKGPKSESDQLVYNGVVYTVLANNTPHVHIFTEWGTHNKPCTIKSTCVCGVTEILTFG